ncbi:ComF family protein [Streptomyces marianii]|uniref:ComF family protein n=1 Tax=Streptomyces marianii TaxID=1817406 RepID=A0A5R9E9Y1_9ACTN|nr:ComF family protein [Streptomyces marianii]TLQ45582.1 ComF family protein [Streptomyces marianii]
MRWWWREVSGLVLPALCAGCGDARTSLCEECAERLAGPPARARPCPEPAGLPVVFAAARYEGVVRSVLLAHKERGALGMAGPLGAALASAVRAASPHGGGARGPLLLVPVPSARRTVRARGHDPARRIAVAAALALRCAGTYARAVPALRQSRRVSDQSGLTAPERLENITGALEATPWAGPVLEGRRAVLVDDVMTTGASLAEGARALRAAFSGHLSEYARMSAAVIAAPSLSFETSRN